MLDSIKNRRSIRKFTDKPVSEEDIKDILEAAMMAPTARNMQEWRFVVVTNREKLNKIAEVNPYAKMAEEASFSVLVCADPTVNPGFERVDCGACIQNMLLEAYSLGIGSCWCALDGRQERIDAYKAVFPELEGLMPIASVQFGYPNEFKEAPDRYDEKKVIFVR